MTFTETDSADILKISCWISAAVTGNSAVIGLLP